MAQADNLNNTSSRWWSLAQTLVWITQRIERPPRDAEEITYSPSIQPEIERAFRVLISEFREAALGVPKGVPIDKFRIPCGRHYVDLLTLFRAPSAESGALSAAMDQFVRNTRWQEVECNSDWLKRAFPAPAPASVPVTNTESSVVEPEAASVDAMTAAAESPPDPASDRQLGRRGNPVWDWLELIKHLKEQKPTFSTKQDALEHYRSCVQRIDRMKPADGPDVKAVRDACKRYDLHQYVTISRPST
jgi:hypothetical protein